MKKIFFFLAICFFVNANAYNNNNKPFIFIENEIEYAVFKNGEFDFTILNNNSRLRGNRSNISFNQGCDYNTYIQKNRFGDIININSTPIFYDYNGRVNRIGNITIGYNNYGYVRAIGNLNIRYNDYGNSYTCSGYVNRINNFYQPRYSRYRVPTRHHHSYRAPIGYATTYYGTNNRGYRTTSFEYNRPHRKYRANTKIVKRNRNIQNKRITKPRTSTYSYSYSNGNTNTRRR